MELWQIVLTIYCLINIVFNFIHMALNLKGAKLNKEYTEKYLKMGKDICNSNEQLQKIDDLSEENAELRMRIEALKTDVELLEGDKALLIDRIDKNE